ncbi:MAG: hypothetical protein K9I69_03390 [Ignavibacteriales bacterium]|nr:hypothetical protein [Ignavibacteriales bacterium]MCF8307271.1 hypothetical protein [Ignavibacteriales bacterium]MCF8438575.1 hypothetical protein [Ignavibacteriales bacterium]
MAHKNTSSELLFYSTEEGKSKIEVRLENETLWLSQKQMAELFHTTKQKISLHIKNVYAEGELEQSSTVKEDLTVQNESGRQVKRAIQYYNLDVIISASY